MNRIYIAGPMKGYPGHNFRAFEHYAKQLRASGFEVVSPHEVGQQLSIDNPKACTQDFLIADLKELFTCDSIFLMEGWTESCGATCEAAVARSLGMSFVDQWGRLMPKPDIIVRRGYQWQEPVTIQPEEANNG